MTHPSSLDAPELLSRLLEDLGSGSLTELSKTMSSHQLTPTSAILDFGRAGRFRVTILVEPPEASPRSSLP